jgi:hypothetical protein
MRSKLTLIGLIAMLGIVIASFSGGLMAGDDASKGCPHGAAKVEGKCCGEGMCKKIQEHQAAMAGAAEKMAEHLDAIREIQSDEEWRVEVEKHLAMVQKYVEQAQNCPMGDMWHEMKHGQGHEAHGEGSDVK